MGQSGEVLYNNRDGNTNMSRNRKEPTVVKSFKIPVSLDEEVRRYKIVVNRAALFGVKYFLYKEKKRLSDSI